jgi:signal transduction histidine kinase
VRCTLQAQHQPIASTDSLKRIAQKNIGNDSLYCDACLMVARKYDELKMFDSMQNWMNKAFFRLPTDKQTLQRFHFHAYQSIAFYYNDLLQLDLYESKKVMKLASLMQDSILLTTGNNFMGLALSNIREYQKAIPYFYEGMKYARQPPYPPQYLVASKPHHLYGNLAEVYIKTGQADSALRNARHSLQLAQAIQSHRGMAVANNLIGLALDQLHLPDSAILFQQRAIQLALENKEVDVALIAMGAMAQIAWNQSDKNSSIEWLQKGFTFLQKQDGINFNFSHQFLDTAMSLYQKMGLKEPLSDILLFKTGLSKRVSQINDEQLGLLIANNVRAEQRSLTLQLSEAQNKSRVANLRLLLSLFILVCVLLFFYLYRYRQQKKMQEIIIRNNLSKDLHDNLGGTLSSVKLYSELLEKHYQTQSPQAEEILGKMRSLTDEAITEISDMVSNIKAGNEDQEELEGRIKNIGFDLLSPKEIKCVYRIDEKLNRPLLQAEARKNILLIIKESFNNVAKYSQANQVELVMKIEKQTLYLSISDNGISFDFHQRNKGNGIVNIESRCKEMRGTCSWQTAQGEGTLLNCIFDLKAISQR